MDGAVRAVGRGRRGHGDAPGIHGHHNRIMPAHGPAFACSRKREPVKDAPT